MLTILVLWIIAAGLTVPALWYLRKTALVVLTGYQVGRAVGRWKARGFPPGGLADELPEPLRPGAIGGAPGG